MKKMFLGIILTLIFTLSFASAPPQSNEEEGTGRQCCTKVVSLGNGGAISVRACAGWFLSNNRRAYARACRKANRALGLE